MILECKYDFSDTLLYIGVKKIPVKIVAVGFSAIGSIRYWVQPDGGQAFWTYEQTLEKEEAKP